MNSSQWINVACNLCGADQPKALYPSTLRAPVSYQPAVHRVGCHSALVRCQRCGMIYANPQPIGLAALYEQCEQDALYESEAAERLRTFSWLLSHLQKYADVGRLLDVGCSIGLLLVAARAAGWDAYGIEPSTWAVRQARVAYQAAVSQGTLADAPSSYREFDAITMVDVLEHSADPAAELAQARRLLRSAGTILISTPDISSAAARCLGEHWWGVLPTHLWYFDRHTLGRMLEQSGFQVLEIARAKRSFSLAYWGSKLGSYSPSMGRAAVWLLRVSRLAERTLWLDLGDQLLMFARKEER